MGQEQQVAGGAVEREETAYEVIERDARSISDGGAKGPTLVLKEIGTYAERNGAPIFGGAIHETLVKINRQASRKNRLRNDLKALLYALGARPLFGGPHLDVETAIARALVTLGAYPLAPRNTKYRTSGWEKSPKLLGRCGAGRTRFRQLNGYGDWSRPEPPL